MRTVCISEQIANAKRNRRRRAERENGGRMCAAVQVPAPIARSTRIQHRFDPRQARSAGNILHSLLHPVKSNPYGLRSRDHNFQLPVCNSFSRKSFIIRSFFLDLNRFSSM